MSGGNESKKCSGPCGLVKPLAAFSLRNKKANDGKVVGKCKECTAAYMKDRLHAQFPDRQHRQFRADTKTGNMQVCQGPCGAEKDWCEFPEQTSKNGLPQKTCTSCQNSTKSTRRLEIAAGKRVIGEGMAYHHPVIDGRKQCRQCNEWKDLVNEFPTRNDTPHGYFHECKDCRRKNALMYGHAVWNERLRNRRLTDEHFRQKDLHRNKVYHIVKSDRYKEDDIDDDIGCRPSELRHWIHAQFTGEMSWENYPDIWTIDHIIPIDMFDLTNDDDRQICCHWSNLQPCTDNFRKHNKYRVNEVADCFYSAITYIVDNGWTDLELPRIQNTLDWIHNNVAFE